jgi:glycosyl transferase family 2
MTLPASETKAELFRSGRPPHKERLLMQLVLFTTTDLRAGRQAEFIRMINSVRAGAGTHVRLKMFALLQRSNEGDRTRYQSILPPDSVVLASPERVSLSEARNRLFAAAQKHTVLDEDCVVAFPDDDCWYPPYFLHRLVASFRCDPRLDMLISRVSLDPVESDAMESSLATAKAWQVVRLSSSNGMFFRGATVAALGDFDCTLGLGTPNGGGEDTEYALRALLIARRAAFVDLPLVGHRESDLASVARYFKGALAALSRYALKRPDIWFEFQRKLAVGAYLVMKSRLPVREYWASIGNSLRELHGSVRRIGKVAITSPLPQLGVTAPSGLSRNITRDVG